jgi:vacuolar protein sorting-associated protein VTA1
VLTRSRQTGDTFQAAATFLELLKIWAAPDTDTQAKIRYAKWNAVRIGKAIKDGKDPNESNPKISPETEEALPALDPNDPEVIALGAAEQSVAEDVPDERALAEANIEGQNSVHQSPSPSAQVIARATSEPSQASEAYFEQRFPNRAVQATNVSPLKTSPNMSSVSENAFPDVPTDKKTQEGDILDLGIPQQPSVQPGLRGADFESFPPPIIPEEPPQDFSTNSPLPTPQLSTQFKRSPSPKHSSCQQSPRQLPLPLEEITNYQEPPHVSLHNSAKKRIIIDDVAIAKAQKHAKWAISALNFEDAETAIRELREALKTLGASS